MKKMIYILFLLISYTAYSQSLSVFNVDASAFPTIKANFCAYDANNKQITNFSNSDFSVTEDGQIKIVKNVICQNPKPTLAISSVLVMDASTSMNGSNLILAKEALIAWINGLPLGKSECAITAFNSRNYLIQDFSTDKSLLIDKANSLFAGGDTDYDEGLLNTIAGGLLITKRAQYKRVIVFLSDGMPNQEPHTAQIIAEAKAQNATIHCVTLEMEAPQCLKDISLLTGGIYFENVTSVNQARLVYQTLLNLSQDGGNCSIEWESGPNCIAEVKNVEVKLVKNGSQSEIKYQPPTTSLTELEFLPESIKFYKAIPGIPKDSAITVTARNADFNITNITSTNSAYSISPTKFFLKSGQSQNMTISYLPADSGYSYTKFEFENDKCLTEYFASGGFAGKKPKLQTLKLIQPNGDEKYPVGADTIITWEGINNNEKVIIEFSTNNGVDWSLITKDAKGLSYKWRVPNKPSTQCLARVLANPIILPDCENGEIKICNQIWTCSNLNVDKYRDGSTIPQVTDSTEWANLRTGAWCYYNNDPEMESIYGKLYNWYAVIDPRGLAPKGWHIPSESEWTELENCLGGSFFAGGKMKSIGTLEGYDGLWTFPNAGATNESGFSALPAGYRYFNGTFFNLGDYASWWTSTGYLGNSALYRNLYFNNTSISKSNYRKENGFSIRCVKD